MGSVTEMLLYGSSEGRGRIPVVTLAKTDRLDQDNCSIR